MNKSEMVAIILKKNPTRFDPYRVHDPSKYISNMMNENEAKNNKLYRPQQGQRDSEQISEIKYNEFIFNEENSKILKDAWQTNQDIEKLKKEIKNIKGNSKNKKMLNAELNKKREYSSYIFPIADKIHRQATQIKIETKKKYEKWGFVPKNPFWGW